ncbi:uncharacterized protein BO87DRAFT_400350 [Aspergillus neoniger CBS 115656]|uniref:Uncharacterized protein n=1 Tax=Aspergillus neoniger (strain CBS 115656) TaxID=1448310 RepID=A0A318YA74_ASPNB|nr:hypothetical protein BO87DRAFT_400350 [Aspergillus neoniger CBS 115656]PYH30487.1 hypothetical protein BO87DRAFT_400350 [Aspergillus neoniger CBS 115656]
MQLQVGWDAPHRVGRFRGLSCLVYITSPRTLNLAESWWKAKYWNLITDSFTVRLHLEDVPASGGCDGVPIQLGASLQSNLDGTMEYQQSTEVRPHLPKKVNEQLGIVSPASLLAINGYNHHLVNQFTDQRQENRKVSDKRESIIKDYYCVGTT